MQALKTELEGLVIVQLETFYDDRGFFCESYNKEKLGKLGIIYDFVQDNHSYSKKNVIRGLHFQSSPGQAKLIRCTRGRILDVAVDIRPDSPTFKKSFSIELSSDNNKMLMIPAGFAHGFAALEESEVQYKCSSTYNSKTEKSICFNDSEFSIDWMVANPIISDRDRTAPSFKEVLCQL